MQIMTKSNHFPWLQCFRGTLPFAANKNESKRGFTATIAVLRAGGGWLCVGRKINASAQVECPTRAHISPFTAWVSAQNVLSKLGSH